MPFPIRAQRVWTRIPLSRLHNLFRLVELISLFLLISFPKPVIAGEGPEPASKGRSFRLGLGNFIYPKAPVSPAGAWGALGVDTVYEFEVKPRFVIGIYGALRRSIGAPGGSFFQINYGLILKHYLHSSQEEAGFFRPYFQYGLLLSVSGLAGRSGSGTAHDTYLAAGGDFDVFGFGRPVVFLEMGYHYSRLRYFSESTVSLDSVAVAIGPRWSW